MNNKDKNTITTHDGFTIELAFIDVKSCISCDHFDEKSEICDTCGKRPPARVIAQGCDAFVNLIPF